MKSDVRSTHENKIRFEVFMSPLAINMNELKLGSENDEYTFIPENPAETMD